MDVLTALSGLASILSIARSVKELMHEKKLTKEEALDRFRDQSSKEDRLLLKEDGVEAAILQMTTISDKLLKQLDSEAHACEAKHIGARKKAKTETERHQADIDAAGCMCRVLRDIKRYNDKILPDGPFQNWWVSYSCSD